MSPTSPIVGRVRAWRVLVALATPAMPAAAQTDPWAPPPKFAPAPGGDWTNTKPMPSNPPPGGDWANTQPIAPNPPPSDDWTKPRWQPVPLDTGPRVAGAPENPWLYRPQPPLVLLSPLPTAELVGEVPEPPPTPARQPGRLILR
jgi:hypothetical protein